MAKCINCAFLLHQSEKSNHICSIEKMRHPSEPGLYIKNPNAPACSKNFRIKTDSEKNRSADLRSERSYL